MRTDAIRWLPAWLCLAVILATAAGGSGGDDEESGIGGTGLVGDEGGIGGTGIVGTITSFGSIHVNGLTIEYGDATPVEIDGLPRRADELAVGQVVEVVAASEGPGLRAERIAVRHAVIGPVDEVDSERGRLRILGQTVEIGARTAKSDRTRAQPLDLAELVPGAFVRVSGLRRGDGAIVATRVERVAEAPEVSLRGPIAALDARGLHISGLRIEAPPEMLRAAGAVGQIVRVRGRWDAARGVLRPAALERAAADFAPGIERLSLEGYLRDDRGDGTLRLEGFEVDAADLGEAVRALPGGVHIRLSGSRSGARGLRIEQIRIDRGAPHGLDGTVPGERGRSAAGERPPRPDPPSRPQRPVRPERPQRMGR